VNKPKYLVKKRKGKPVHLAAKLTKEKNL